MKNVLFQICVMTNKYYTQIRTDITIIKKMFGNNRWIFDIHCDIALYWQSAIIIVVSSVSYSHVITINIVKVLICIVSMTRYYSFFVFIRAYNIWFLTYKLIYNLHKKDIFLTYIGKNLHIYLLLTSVVLSSWPNLLHQKKIVP